MSDNEEIKDKPTAPPTQNAQFKLQVSLEVLRTRKLFLATPMYGGQCHGSYTRSMMDLTGLCKHYGVEMQTYFLFNESLITRARNYYDVHRLRYWVQSK